MLLLNERPGIQFYVGLVIMILATVLMVKDTVTLQHTHIHTADESLHDHPYDGDGSEVHIHTHETQPPTP